MSNILQYAAQIALMAFAALGIAGPSQAIQGVASPEPAALTEFNLQIAHMVSQVEQKKLELEKLDLSRADLNEKMNLTETRRNELLKRQDELGVSAESFADIIRSLQTSRVDLIIDLAGIDARRSMVQQSIDVEAKNGADSDLVAMLEELVGLRASELERATALFQKQSIPQSDVLAANRGLLESKIRLLETKAAINGQAASVAMDQLTEISLDRAEKKARLEKVESLLAQFTSERETISDAAKLGRTLDNYLMDIDAVDKNAGRIDSYIDAIQTQIDEMLKNPPKVDR